MSQSENSREHAMHDSALFPTGHKSFEADSARLIPRIGILSFNSRMSTCDGSNSRILASGLGGRSALPGRCSRLGLPDRSGLNGMGFLIQRFNLLLVLRLNHAAFQFQCGSDLAARDSEFVRHNHYLLDGFKLRQFLI
jgi:hypothetical protein